MHTKRQGSVARVSRTYSYQGPERLLREGLEALTEASTDCEPRLRADRKDGRIAQLLLSQAEWTPFGRYRALSLLQAHADELPDLLSATVFGTHSAADIDQLLIARAGGVRPAEIGEELLAEKHFAIDPAERLFAYRDGTYGSKGTSEVKVLVKKKLRRDRLLQFWSSKFGSEVVEYVRLGAKRLWTLLPLDEINVLNGILDVRTRRLRPHTPSFLSPVQIPVEYDPDAVCPAWNDFLQSLFDDRRAVRLIHEIAGDAIVPDRSIPSLFVFLGGGGNGKSTLLSGLSNFVGSENVSAVSLQELATDRFASVALVDKLVNVVADLPSTALVDTSLIKAITGGDEIRAQEKHRPAFKFRPRIRLLFAANEMPAISDRSRRCSTVCFWFP